MTLSLTDAARLTAGATMWTTGAVPERGARSVMMADGPMGVASGRVDERDVSVLTPAPVAQGASWDLDLVAQMGALVGNDAIAMGVDALLAPNVNLARSPLAGRAFEYYSEDPLLTGLCGAAWVRGIQSTGTGAVAKHFVCNDSETQRDTMNAVVDDATLRQVYLLPFEMACAAGCGGIMTAYNRVNGDWCAQGPGPLAIVRNEWAYGGVLMSDFFATHSTAPTLNAGLDLEMPGPARFLGAKAEDAVAQGAVSAARVQDAAERVVRFNQRFGGAKTPATLDAEELLTAGAAAGFVLLRNDGLLPLAPTIRTLAVIGPNATAPCYQGGTFARIAVTPDALTPLQAIEATLGQSMAIVHEPGVDPQPRLPSMPVTPAMNLGDGYTTGLTVEYFAGHDLTATPLSRETRATNSLVWFHGVHDQGRFNETGAVRASGWFTAQADGPHRFYAGATGPVVLKVDGVDVVDRAIQPPASDIMGVLKAGDADDGVVTLAAGQRVLVEVELRYAPARVQGLWYGVRAPDTPDAMLARAVDAARQADAVVLMLGETADASVESKDRADTRLDPAQLRLAEAVRAANSRTAVVVNVGHAFDASFAADDAALLVAWYPGQNFGKALADVLAGTREPGGRLPMTLAAAEADYPALNLTPDADGNLAYDDGVLVGYRGLKAQGKAALFPLGAGQGYTRFTLDDARIVDGQVLVKVTNTGGRPGSEVIQAYLAQSPFALVGFAKLHLEPGETATATITPSPYILRAVPGSEPVSLVVGRDAQDAAFALTLPR
ncbi:glycoside hydrolase family 3 C-terminal domain-containing protein [Novosphingobium sp. SG720]|uniref:beta-glucosidase n=1 Tax=Novosphingobium sp. SG720 TaxID=2586998 RepID=UPI0014465493|nr:glycoside hydrolase family 3 C-terminal domain-containing protein [Novosphingobium sp. SG720]NKJ41286.1 beta-glucosidase [Novosphingobium sp. SG720]